MLTIPFNSSSATLSNVGGKGYNLSILSHESTKLQSNISVPSGFIIATTAYDNFIKENLHLLQLIEGVDDHLVASSTTDNDDIANLESVSSMIQNEFRDCTLSKELRDEIDECLLDISSSGSSIEESYYAVR
jgi:phosphoenolpyruvate synthase/pyruvate phosphate dikinase